jgi:hypothetical protein
MPARTEKGGDHPKGREKALRLSRRLEASHTPLSFSRRLVRVLCSVVEPCMLLMLHRRQDLGLCGVAAQLVGDNHPWNVLKHLQQFAEELLRSQFVTPRLDKNVEHLAVLVDGPP